MLSFINLILISFILFESLEELAENDFLFQIFPSFSQENPNYFYAQTKKNLLTIQTTETHNTFLFSENIDDNFYLDISSISIIDNIFIIKSCLGANVLVQIEYKNEEKFIYNRDLSEIKFCYSTKIKNPNINSKNPDEFAFITYWAEYETTSQKIFHKCILFYPISNIFSEEFTLSSSNAYIDNTYYPEACDTFRNEDIFCSIHYSDNNNFPQLYGDYYVLETNKIFFDFIYKNDSSIYLVLSKTKKEAGAYQKPISMGITNNNLIKSDIYMTEFHYFEYNGKGKTFLLFSFYNNNNNARKSIIPYYEGIVNYAGLNIQDQYIHQNLFNYLISNNEELIVLYIYKQDKMKLMLTRLNITNTKSITNFKDYSKYYLIIYDICQNPKYFQSIYITSLIN